MSFKCPRVNVLVSWIQFLDSLDIDQTRKIPVSAQDELKDTHDNYEMLPFRL